MTVLGKQIKYSEEPCIRARKEELLAETPRFHSVDRIDSSIMRTLQEKGRESFAEIGKTVGLAATSIAERIRRLENAGVIEGYKALIDPAKVGYPITAFILTRPNGPDARFIETAAGRPEILACSRVTGEFSFIARAVVRDVRHLEELLNYLEPATVHVVTLVQLSTSFEDRPVSVNNPPR